MAYYYRRIPGWDEDDDIFQVYDDSKWDPEKIAAFYDEGLAAKFVREHNEREHNERL